MLLCVSCFCQEENKNPSKSGWAADAAEVLLAKKKSQCSACYSFAIWLNWSFSPVTPHYPRWSGSLQHDGPTVTVKPESSLPPPHILSTAATTAACVGARCFPFCRCCLSRESRNQERALLTADQGAGVPPLPRPAPPRSLSFMCSLNVNYSDSHFQQVNPEAPAGSWETGLFSLAAVELAPLCLHPQFAAPRP